MLLKLINIVKILIYKRKQKLNFIAINKDKYPKRGNLLETLLLNISNMQELNTSKLTIVMAENQIPNNYSILFPPVI